MKRNVWIFGLILGTVLTGHMVYMVSMIYSNENIETNDVVGYAAMVVVFSMTFFGIRNYRNKELNGVISFGKAFKTGALIALVGSTMYVVVWLFYYYLFVPDFVDRFAACELSKATRHGATASEIADKNRQLAQLKEMYKTPFFIVLITYIEVLPVGLVVAFISSLILKRKQKAIAA